MLTRRVSCRTPLQYRAKPNLRREGPLCTEMLAGYALCVGAAGQSPCQPKKKLFKSDITERTKKKNKNERGREETEKLIRGIFKNEAL